MSTMHPERRPREKALGALPAALAAAALLVTILPRPALAQEEGAEATTADTARVAPVQCRDGDAVDPGAPGVPWADTAAAVRYAGEQLGAEDLAAVSLDSLMALGDRAFAASHHTVAYVAYATAARRDGYEAHWKASRAAVDVGQDVGDEDEADEWYGVGERLARRAIELRPDAPEGHLHLSQALGLVALQAGVRERVKLSKEIREEALATIEADSSYAGGWHVLGRWHKGVMELPGFGRFFARTFLGGEVLSQASWENAARHLERAAELEPDRIVHQLALGDVYRQTDRPEMARQQYRKVLETAPADRHDCVYKAEARSKLEEMGG